MTSKYGFDDYGAIEGGLEFPQFLYDRLTPEEIEEVRKYVADRFEMGYWYGGRA